MSAKDPPFPTTARVGYRTYRVEDWPHEVAAALERLGMSDPQAAVIRVDRHNGPHEAADTLLHELLHAIHHVAAVDAVEDASEEFLARVVASGLTQVMRDSPEVRDWLAWAWAQES